MSSAAIESSFRSIAQPESQERHYKSAPRGTSSRCCFLPCDIPRMIRGLPHLFSGLTHRATSGSSHRVQFPSQHLSADQLEQLKYFHQFNESHQPSSLKASEARKAEQLLNETAAAYSEAKLRGAEPVEIEALDKKIHDLALLLTKNKARIPRTAFTLDDWKMLDLVKFELVKENCAHLVQLFNSEWFNEFGVKAELLQRFNINYYEAMIAETLSFSLAYIEGLEGQAIALPVLVDGEYQLASYTIKKIIFGDALPGYILESSHPKAHPWLVIRGTQRYTKISPNGNEYREGSLESIVADFIDSKCIARYVINKSLVVRRIETESEEKKSLSEIFIQWKLDGKKVILCGHSFGGNLTNALFVEFFMSIKAAYAFNATGVSKEISYRWQQILSTAKEADVGALVNFNSEGDLVPSSGHALIGHHVAIKPIVHAPSTSAYHAHVRSHLNREFEIQKVDVIKESSKWLRAVCERIRIIVGRVLLFFLYLFSGQYIPDWWKNRKIYHEKASLQRQNYALTT